MANAKQLPSGAWRTLVYSHTEIVNGKSKRIYESFTSWDKDESQLMASQFRVTKKKKKVSKLNMTVGEVLDKYIEMCEVLSKTTTAGYIKIRNYAFQDIMNTKVKDLDNETMQLAINREARRITKQGKLISPKTVINEYGLLSSALKAVVNMQFSVKKPTVPAKNINLPSPDIVVNAIKNTSIELPCMLAIWLSFSMSEVRGLMVSSIKNDIISIDRVVVDVDNKPLVKDSGKAEKRIRKHQIPPYIMELIKKQETYQAYLKDKIDRPLIDLNYSQIFGRFRTITKNAGINITFHQLRHLNASVMLMLNIPEKYAMERGGWKTPHTMKKVYQHTFSEPRKVVDNQIDNYFNSIVSATRNATRNNKHTEK